MLVRLKEKNLYISIKQQLKYGPATGKDKSDKNTKLKLIFTHLMNYQDTIDYLFQKLPIYQKVEKALIKKT